MDAYTIICGTNQSDSTAAKEEIIATSVPTLAECRRIIACEIGVSRLMPARRWKNPADGVVEGWCASLDTECSDGYFVREQ